MVDTSTHPFPGRNKEEQEARERELARQKRLVQSDKEEQRIRRIVSDEFKKQVRPYLFMVLLIGLVWWQSWIGFGIWFAIVIAFALYERFREDRKPAGGYVGLTWIDTENYVRHCIIADLERRGKLGWEAKDGGVIPADDPEWSTFWRRVETVGTDFDQGSPRYRRRKIAEAKRRSLAARLAMRDYAKAHGLKPLYWARVEPRERSLWRRIVGW